jgi:hypothetical protein
MQCMPTARAGLVHVAWGGRRLARNRHHLDEAGLIESEWRLRLEAERWFCQADGEATQLRPVE